MIYKIVDITDHDGNTRKDGRYPLRIGRTGIFFYEPIVGQCLIFEFFTDADGAQYNGFLHTSTITSHTIREDGVVVVQTLNSIYTFEEYNESKAV